MVGLKNRTEYKTDMKTILPATPNVLPLRSVLENLLCPYNNMVFRSAIKTAQGAKPGNFPEGRQNFGVVYLFDLAILS